MKFKELLAAARVRVKNREGMRHEASCVHICESYLGPYEEARASLYKKSKSPVPIRKRKGLGSIMFNYRRRQRLLRPRTVRTSRRWLRRFSNRFTTHYAQHPVDDTSTRARSPTICSGTST
eukprot:scaffold9920_cov122-Isochrysis_galbana.AAC.4